MRNIFKNKFLIGLVVIFANTCFCDALALSEQTKKIWTRDKNGRVLVYSKEPSKEDVTLLKLGAIIGLGSSFGGMLFIGFCPGIRSDERVPMMIFPGLMGSIILIPTALAFKSMWHQYSLLYKPLIIIDKGGITYKEHSKILWKNICSYELKQKSFFSDGYNIYVNYAVEINMNGEILEIPEDETAITSQMLYKLIDEAYKLYQV